MSNLHVRCLINSIMKLLMFLNKKSALTMQIKVFIQYRPKTISIDERDEETLFLFARMSNKADISEIVREDVQKFKEFIWRIPGGNYRAMCSMQKIEALLRYYHFYTKIKLPKKQGRPANLDKIREVKELVDAGYTHREVEEKTGVNLSLVNRYYHYEFDKSGKVLK